ncbi:hypothetical protein GS575_23570 [Rhodococcus hoagii]|nr:hypothetical protein [Prescottella equi]
MDCPDRHMEIDAGLKVGELVLRDLWSHVLAGLRSVTRNVKRVLETQDRVRAGTGSAASVPPNDVAFNAGGHHGAGAAAEAVVMAEVVVVPGTSTDCCAEVSPLPDATATAAPPATSTNSAAAAPPTATRVFRDR